MKVPEKRCARERRGYGGWLKKLAVKSNRREAKRDPEGAPRKLLTYGWST